MLAPALSALVYLGCAAALTLEVRAASGRKPRLIRLALLLLGVAALAGIASLEIGLSGLPFWSRDFSLTWTVFTVSLGLAAARLLPRLIASVRASGRRSESEASSDPASSSSEHTAPGGIGNEPGSLARQTGIGAAGRAWDRLRIPVAALLGAMLVVICWRGAERNLLQVNTDPDRVDQSAYLNYAVKMADTDFSHVGNRNRMPLYPFLLTFVVDPAAPVEEMFLTAKVFSLGLSLVLVILIGALVVRRLPVPAAAAVFLITALYLFAFKAAYVQADLLFYALLTLVFLWMVDYLRRPTLALAPAIGIASGLAYLTKATALLSLIVFVATAALPVVLGAAGPRARRSGPDARRRNIDRIFGLVVIVGFFLLTTFPYLKNSWYRFGRPFYNVNSTFYIWYDTWAEVERGTKAHGDRSGWPDMPASEIPSLAKYLREHTPAEIVGRISRGIALTTREAALGYGYAPYTLVLVAALAAVAVARPVRVLSWIRAHPDLALFLAGFFGLQFLAFAWYAEFVLGNRLVLALLVPLLSTASLGLHRLTATDGSGRLGLATVANAIVIGAIALDVITGYAGRLGSMFGGS